MPALRGTVDWNTQTQFPQFTPEAFRRIFGNSPVIGGERADHIYNVIIQESQRAGLAPSFVAGIIAHETGAGRGYNPTTGAPEAIIAHNNPGGLMSGNRHLHFDSIEDGIRSTAENAANVWIRAQDAGTPTLGAFRSIWAPDRANNDTRRLNQYWVAGTERYLGNMGNAALPWATPENLNWHIPQAGPGTGNIGTDADIWQPGQGFVSPEAMEFAERIGQGALLEGPAGYLTGWLPWTQGGSGISSEFGDILQHHGLMPGNLRRNQETGNWDPIAGQLPRTDTSIWGGPAVQNWYAMDMGALQGNQGYQSILRDLNYDISGQSGTWTTTPLGLERWDVRANEPGLQTWDASDPYNRGEPGVHVITQPSGPQPAGGGGLIWNPAGGGWGTGDVSLQAGGAELAAHGNPNNWFYNPVMQNWGSFGGGGGVGHETEDYNQWYNNVMGGYADNPEQFDIGPYGGGNNAAVTSVLADIQSGAAIRYSMVRSGAIGIPAIPHRQRKTQLWVATMRRWLQQQAAFNAAQANAFSQQQGLNNVDKPTANLDWWRFDLTSNSNVGGPNIIDRRKGHHHA